MNNSLEINSEQSDLPEIPEADIQQLYFTACQLFQEKKYADSAKLFTLLTTLNPHANNYWLGLGLSQQNNLQYETALMAFDMALWADSNDPRPYLYAADCYLCLNGKQLALQHLDKAIKLASTQQQYQALKEEAVKKQTALKF